MTADMSFHNVTNPTRKTIATKLIRKIKKSAFLWDEIEEMSRPGRFA